MAYAKRTATASSEEAQSGLRLISPTPRPTRLGLPMGLRGARRDPASLHLPAIYPLPEEAAHDSAFNVVPPPLLYLHNNKSNK